MTHLDLLDGYFYQPAEFPTLLLRDRGPQVLDLGRVLAHKHDHCYIRDSTDPGIADELGVERKQACGIFRIPTRCGFPVNHAAYAVDFTDRVEVSNKLASSQRLKNLDLEILLWIANMNPVCLHESFKQVNSLVHETVSGISLLVVERSIAVDTPLLEQGCAAILPPKIACKRTLEAASESHSRSGFLFAPAVKIAVAIAARAAEILADLCVAIGHQRPSGPR